MAITTTMNMMDLSTMRENMMNIDNMDRLGVINELVDKLEVEDYLEIGVFTGYTLDGCNAKNKLGIDPHPEHYTSGKHQVIGATSDQFFDSLDPKAKFKLIFLDGLHEAHQVRRDFENSLKHLSKGGAIVLHDVNPPKYEHTTTGIDGCWTGDVYKIAIWMRPMFPYNYFTVDTDWGVGVYQNGELAYHWFRVFGGDFKGSLPDIAWETFDAGRKQLLNLISYQEFIKRIDGTITSSL